MGHVPVLLNEAIDGLALKPGDTLVDATLGAGGHSSEIIRRYGSGMRMIGFDLDSRAMEIATGTVQAAGGQVLGIHANFRFMEAKLREAGIETVDGVLFDLGVSSMEFGASGRGFSFRFDEPLLMTLESDPGEDTLTARDIVNSYREEELATAIFEYGEERFSRRIAKAIVTARRKEPITTTFELVDVIRGAVPASYRNGRINCATRTFQALRIATNDELGALKDGLQGAWNVLKPGGRIAVITFHSLEDRIAKNMFREWGKEEGKVITKKPLVPSDEELSVNPRSRSSKLRIIQKL